jgi:hypothetical protein
VYVTNCIFINFSDYQYIFTAPGIQKNSQAKLYTLYYFMLYTEFHVASCRSCPHDIRLSRPYIQNGLCEVTWHILAMSWYHFKAGSDVRPIYVRFVVDRLAQGQVFLLNVLVFYCQYYAINAPYSSSSLCYSYQKSK